MQAMQGSQQPSAPSFGSGAAAVGTFAPGTAGPAATAMVELSLSAENLLDMDVFSKSDPFVVIYNKPFGSEKWQELGRTEVIMNNLDPQWTMKVKLAYLFEEQQHLKFEVYDHDSQSNNLEDHDFIGACTTTLGQIMTSGRATLELVNRQGRLENGRLTIFPEEISTCKDDIELQFMGKNLERNSWFESWFNSSNPFLQFSRSTENGNFVVVHRTETIKGTLSPVWAKFTIPISLLCNGDLDRNLKVECLNYNSNGSHSLLGEFYVTVRQLQMGQMSSNDCNQNVYDVINPKKKKEKANYKNSGLVHLVHSQTHKGFSFLDYIRGGTELACTFSIDFTQSNGNPSDPRSLHYLSDLSSLPNPYESALSAVGQIIEDYDTDKLFPVLGFGARLPPDGRVDHCFYVNGHDTNPYCQGMVGVLNAYRACIQRIQLYGPTNFAPTVNHVSNIARSFLDGSQYFILLIVTDGIITDMPQTKSAIVEASMLPMSIIIVGVGDADFTAMEELDGDTVRLTSPDGKVAARDIVQFVPFNNFSKVGLNSHLSRLHLAREVLAEVPGQFVSFMKSRRIQPKPPQVTVTPGTLPPDPEVIASAS